MDDEPCPHRIRPSDARPAAPRWLWLTVPLTLLLILAATAGLLADDLYGTNTPLMAAQLVGGDLLSLVVVVPLLAGSSWLAARGSTRARLVWLGCLFFLIYFYLVFCFHVRFNALFPAYLGLLGGATYGLIFGLTRTDPASVAARFSHRAPVNLVSLALAIVPTLFYAINLGDIIPAIRAGVPPKTIVQFGAPTYFAHVLDMALALPAYGIAAVYLWRRRAVGFLLGAALLTLIVLMMFALLSMFAVQRHRGLPVATADVAIIGTVAASYATLLFWFLLSVRD